MGFCAKPQPVRFETIISFPIIAQFKCLLFGEWQTIELDYSPIQQNKARFSKGCGIEIAFTSTYGVFKTQIPQGTQTDIGF
jgi:hypothetical protein